MTRQHRAHRRRAVQSARDARKRTGRKIDGPSKAPREGHYRGYDFYPIQSHYGPTEVYFTDYREF